MKTKLTRKSFFIDERELDEARRALGAATDAETVREALREVARMKVLARFMERTRGTLAAGSFSTPLADSHGRQWRPPRRQGSSQRLQRGVA